MTLKNNLKNPKNFNRSYSELQEFLLLCVFVAGKNSKTQSEKLSLFLKELNWPKNIFKCLKELSKEEIFNLLVKIKSGQYTRLCKCLFELSRSNLNLFTCTCEDLEKISGIGMKTSRFFITYSRDNSNYAILDTHILKWLKQFQIEVPKQTPNNKKKYLYYENVFLNKCLELNLKPHELDLQIWLEKQKSWN